MSPRLRTILVAAFWLLALEAGSAAELRCHFIYVGQGDCTLIQTPDGKNVLVDCGSTRDGDPDAVREYVRSHIGANGSIDTLVVTHPDADHYNYVEAVLEGTDVKKVLYVGTLDEYPHADFQSWLRQHDDKVRLRTGDAVRPGHPSPHFEEGQVRFQILAADVGDETNARSIVLLVSYGEFDALLTGDATEETEADILSRYDATFLDVELLKLGHHGSNTSTSAPWLEAVRPEMAVVSAAYHSQYAHPRKTVIDRVTDFTDAAPSHPFRQGVGSGSSARLRNIYDFREAVYSTATTPNIVVASNGTTYRLEAEELPTDGPIALRAAPRAPLSPLGVAARPLPPDSRALPTGLPAATIVPRTAGLPLPAGASVVIVTKGGVTVSGKLGESTAVDWVQITETGTGQPAFVRGSEIAVIRQAH